MLSTVYLDIKYTRRVEREDQTRVKSRSKVEQQLLYTAARRCEVEKHDVARNVRTDLAAMYTLPFELKRA